MAIKNFFVFLFFLWFFRQTRAFLFWLYLWQKKEYHLGRFVDHFRTEKGKKIFKNPIFLTKVFFLLLSFFWQKFFLLFLVFFLYFLEATKNLFDFFKKRWLFPKFTKKIIFLSFASFCFLTFFSISLFSFDFSFLKFLLIFDVLGAGVFSGIVLFFQPLSFFWKQKLIFEATKKREKFKDLIVVGICGSFGKTSTKEFLATLLEQKYQNQVLKTKEHQNSEVAISSTILKDLKENHRFFVCEMGAYNKGGIKLLTKIARPKVAILTGVNEQHLALFGSMENLIFAEGGKELLESLPKDGLAIFNGENEILKNLYESFEGNKKIVFVEKEEGDLRAKILKLEKEKVLFEAKTKEGEKEIFEVKVFGRHYVENLLLAILAAKELGMNLKECKEAAKKIKPEQTGIFLKKTKEGIDLIDCTFSSNPDGVLAHLDYLSLWEQKKAIVFSGLIELGKKSKEVHERIGQKIAKVCDLALFLTKDAFLKTKSGIEKVSRKDKILILKTEDEKKAAFFLKNFCQKGDVILFEGREAKKVLQEFLKISEKQ